MSDAPVPGSGDRALWKFLGFGCLLPIAVVTLLMVVVIAWPKDTSPRSGDAIVACHSAVRDLLRSPATADFRSSASGSGPWTVTGTVDAENGFGATVRAEFECESNGTSATVIYFNG